MMENNINQQCNEVHDECEEISYSEFDYDTEIEEMKCRWRDISSRTEFVACDESIITIDSSLSELTNSSYTTESRATNSIFSDYERSESDSRATDSIFSNYERSEKDCSDKYIPHKYTFRCLEGSTDETGSISTISYDQEVVTLLNNYVNSLNEGYEHSSNGSLHGIKKLQQKEIEILHMKCDSSLEKNVNFDRYKYFCDDSIIQVGLQLEESGNYYEAKDRYLDVLMVQKKINSATHFDLSMIMSYRRLACINYKLKERELAITYYKEAIRIFEQHEKDVQENVGAWEAYVKTLSDLGVLYSRLKKPKQAVLLHEKAIEVLQKNNNEAHHEIYPEICYHMGVVYEEADMHYEAYMCHFKLSIYLRENCEIKTTKTNREIEASNLLEKKTDIERIEILNKICVLFTKKNEFREALYCCDDALTICESTSKASVEDIIMTHINKGNVLSALNKVDDAIACFSKALCLSDKSNEVTRIDWKDRSEVIFNIGISYYKQGSLKNADHYFQKFLKSSKIISTSDNEKQSFLLRRTDALHNLGKIRCQMGDYKAAITFYQESLKQKLVLYGEYSEEVFQTTCNLGTAYFDAKNFDLAKSIFKNLLSSERKRYVKDLERASLLNKLGNVDMARKEFKEALINYKKSLMIKQRILKDKNHSDILITVHNIALALLKEGKYDEAITILSDIRKRYRAKIGEFHPLIGKINLDLANAFLHTGEINKAELDCLSAIKALNLAQVPKNHPYNEYSRKMMRKVLMKRNNVRNTEIITDPLTKDRIFTQTSTGNE